MIGVVLSSAHPHALPSTIDATAPCYTMAALAWHRTLVWTLEDIAIPCAFGLVTMATLPHVSLTDSIRYDTAPLLRPLEVCFLKANAT